MSTATRKPPSSNPNRRSFIGSPSIPRSTPTPPPGANGVARRNTIRADEAPVSASIPRRNSLNLNGSPVSARSAAKGRLADATDEELASAAVVEDLKARLAKSEKERGEYEEVVKGLKERLDESIKEQAKLEEVAHSKTEEVERLKVQIQDLVRDRREKERLFEQEREATSREKEEMYHREQELIATTTRLREQLAEKRSKSANNEDTDSPVPASTPTTADFAPRLPTTPNNPSLLHHKDRLIADLRLEVASLQTELSMARSTDGSAVADLEKQLMEVKMQNARLIEESYKFQTFMQFGGGDVLDAVAALNSPPPRTPSPQGTPRRKSASNGLGSLADELDSAAQEEEESAESEKYRKLESEYKQLKDQNKSLAAYINNLIERLLQHKDFETILDKTASQPGSTAGSLAPSAAPSAAPSMTNLPAAAANAATKELPPVPKEEPEARPIDPVARTKSLAARRASMKPMPIVPPSDSSSPRDIGTPTSPTPASIARSQSLRQHSRSRSEAGPLNTANIITNMRGTGPAGTMQRGTLFGSSRASIGSQESGHTSPGGSSVAGTVVGGNKLRPLRLVEEVSPGLNRSFTDGFDERKTKRQSWLGGWFAGKKSAGDSPVEREEVVFERRDVE